MNPLERRRPELALLALACAFFAATAWLGKVPGTWNSPDETANAFWAERVASRSPLAVPDAAVEAAGGIVHPRSFSAVGGALVPGSFPGIFLLYGAARGAFDVPLHLITPFLTALAGLALYAVFRRLFDARLALVSAALFYLHPAVIYYSARGLFHNALLVDLLAFAAYLFVARPSRFARLNDLAGGALVGWAVVTRASEAPWILLAGLAFLPFAGADRWRRLGLAAAGALLPLVIFGAMNARTFGSPFRTSYAPPVRTAPAAEAPSEAIAPAASASRFVLPFGLHPRNVVRHGATYLLAIFWWMTILSAVGLASSVRAGAWRDPARRRYLYAAFGVTVWLALLYGSWYVRDHYDPSRVTIGTSYVRYFLPAYVLFLPFAASGLVMISERFRARGRVMAVLLLVCAAFSLRLALFAGDENLLAVRETLEGNAAKKATLLAELPPDAVVMTARHDKVLFPERLRVIPASDDASFRALADLSAIYPAYWYGVKPDAAALETLRARFRSVDLDLEERPAPDPSEALYRLSRHVD